MWRFILNATSGFTFQFGIYWTADEEFFWVTALKVRGFDVEIMGQLDFFFGCGVVTILRIFWVRGCQEIMGL